ncbi:hypothetical protein BD410DRAFT_724405, partial [Rickenella mellea]
LNSVLSWTSNGDAFVVNDTTTLTQSILPKFFGLSNFSRFVRKPNKYDFYEVRRYCLNWTFRHPDFHADRGHTLENIKRKEPGRRRKQSLLRINTCRVCIATQISVQLVELERLRQSQDSTAHCLGRLEGNYTCALEDLVDCDQNISKQENVMQFVVQYIQQGAQCG